MHTVSVVVLSLLGAAIATGGAGPRVALTRETLRRYLTDQVGYSDRDWRDVLAGRAVAKNLETPETVDVSIFGAVRVRRRASDCTASGFLDSGLTVFASTPPRPAQGGRVAPGPGFGSRTSPASSARCTSA